MLIVKLLGGLGNQMFQYAFGCSLKHSKHKSVRFDSAELLDRSPQENVTYRDFELDVFAYNEPFATSADIELFTRRPIGLLERASFKIRCGFEIPVIYKEKNDFIYDSEVWGTRNCTYFDGYWQSEKYFIKYANTIRQAFTFRTEPKGQNALLAQQIKSQNAVSVHVRRGDYVSNSLYNHVHGTCSPAYYHQAVQYITARVNDAVLYIFSDDPEWVSQNMVFDLPTVYVTHNHGKNSFEDMRLMSFCRHNIIANSSFSWWGAWLNANPEKIVVAPRQWLKTTTFTADLLPEAWIQL